ncbi:hypothetical protein [Parasitella parasitica]|uniref:Reverse transcriptase domain-containing protein n=1 Tax=Parasitella parasitica TaxID=35722 RepID=A0A0B7N0A5_9FUNG|nr:hypothetical protein [Parasitella parasitica]
MDLFCRASNARFNHNKVEAFSISGRDTSGFWARHLQDMNMQHMRTVKDPDPLIYLGFPLIQITQQPTNYIVIRKLKQGLRVHSDRSLSVVGKATVGQHAATLQMLITSVAIHFLKQDIFPLIPWATWTLPRYPGGLGILDVKQQSAALYFRWVQPLLAIDTPRPP